MIIAVIDSLKFIPDVHKHTVYYHENAQKFAFEDWRSKLGTFKAVLAKDEYEAVGKLSEQLRNYVSNSWLGGDVEDFRFFIRYTEVEDGQFWLEPSIFICKEFKL